MLTSSQSTFATMCFIRQLLLRWPHASTTEFRDKPLDFAPGAKEDYSNSN